MATLKTTIVDGDIKGLQAQLSSNSDFTQLELDKALAVAVSSQGHIDAVVSLLAHGARINSVSFIVAVEQENVAVLQAFLDYGWDINSVEFDDPALRYGSPSQSLRQPRQFLTHPRLVVENESLVRWFLDHGADPNVRSTEDVSPLATAALLPSTAVLELLLEHGAGVDPQALFSAMNSRGQGGLPIMKWLIDRGADVNFVHPNMGTPLNYAVHIGSKSKLELLLQSGADRSIKNSMGRTPLELATMKGTRYEALVELLA